MLCPISPGSRSSRPSHKGPSWQRSSPSSRQSIRKAAVSRPGPLAKLRSYSVWRFRRMIGMPSRGSKRSTYMSSSRRDTHRRTQVRERATDYAASSRGRRAPRRPRRHTLRFRRCGRWSRLRPASAPILADQITSKRDGIGRQLRTSKQSAASLRRPGFSASARPIRRPGFSAFARPIERATAPARTDRRNTGSRGPPSHL
jgi:hypothetical protein